MLDLSVEQSRANRLERQKSRFRDRGGIYVPPTTNGLRDILLARSVTGESPVKRRQSIKDLSETDKGKAKSTGATRPPGRATKQRTTISNAEENKSDNVSQWVAGPSYSGNSKFSLPSAPKTTISASESAHKPASAPAPKRRGRPPKSLPVQIVDSDEDSDVASPTRKPKLTAKSKGKTVTSTKKRSLTANLDNEDSNSDSEFDEPPKRKRPKTSASASKAKKVVSSKKASSSSKILSGADQKRKQPVRKTQPSRSNDVVKSKVGRTSTSGTGKSKMCISDDAYEEDEVTNKSKPPMTASRNSNKKRTQREQKQEDSDSETEESPVPTAHAIQPPRTKSRFQAGCNLPVIEEESEEEMPEKPDLAPSWPFQSMTLRKLVESRSVVNRDVSALESSSNEGTAKPREKSPFPDTRKRPREVDIAPEGALEAEKALPSAKPARKRAKTQSSLATKAAPSPKATKAKKSSSKKTSRKNALVTSVQKEDDCPSVLTKVTVTVDESAKTIHSRRLKENVDVVRPTAKLAKGNKAPTSSKVRAVKGPPRSVLDRIKVAFPPSPADSDDDPLDFLS